MKKVFSKEKVKKFWKENKEFIISAGVAIGGVAAGMSAAAKARRLDKEAEITVYEK